MNICHFCKKDIGLDASVAVIYQGQSIHVCAACYWTVYQGLLEREDHEIAQLLHR